MMPRSTSRRRTGGISFIPMSDFQVAHTEYEALRERDRTIASMQSKQHMRPVFAQLFDDAAQAEVSAMLDEQLAAVRDKACTLATTLARRVLIEIGIDDLSRLGAGLQRLDTFLTSTPHEALDVCFDLLTFLDSHTLLRDGPRNTFSED